jgi:hypothetical protein
MSLPSYIMATASSASVLPFSMRVRLKPNANGWHNDVHNILNRGAKQAFLPIKYSSHPDDRLHSYAVFILRSILLLMPLRNPRLILR